MDIKTLTEEHLFNIANIATGGYFKSQFSSEQKEVETGGYGLRRKVEWIFEGEKHYFEISAEDKNSGWNWGSWCIDGVNKKHFVKCVDPVAIVDYCDEHGIDCRNSITHVVTEEPTHVCGAQGFNQMLGDVCDACEKERPKK